MADVSSASTDILLVAAILVTYSARIRTDHGKEDSASWGRFFEQGSASRFKGKPTESHHIRECG